jgi:plasmid stabilization system protein ParE
MKFRWTLWALAQLRDVAAYIALENPEAAAHLVHRVMDRVDRLEAFPKSGRKVPEFPSLPHREVVVPPCRVFYLIQGTTAWVVHVTRSERILRPAKLGQTLH